MTIKSLLTTKKFETTRWKDFLKMNILHTFRKRERGMIYDFQFTAAEKRTVRFCFSVLSLVATATVWQRPTSLPSSVCQGAAGWPSAHQSCSLLGGWSPWSAGTPWTWRQLRTRWTGPSGTGGRSWSRGTPSPISTNTTLTQTPDHQVGIVYVFEHLIQ